MPRRCGNTGGLNADRCTRNAPTRTTRSMGSQRRHIIGLSARLRAAEQQPPGSVPSRERIGGDPVIFGELTQSADLVRAAKVGAVAAVIAALGWIACVVASRHELGFIAIMVGAFVGGGVALGAGAKRGWPIQITAVTLTLATLLVSQYVITNALLLDAAAKSCDHHLPAFFPPDLVLESAVNVLKQSKNLLFWVIACAAAFALTAKRGLRYTDPPLISGADLSRMPRADDGGLCSYCGHPNSRYRLTCGECYGWLP